MSRPLRANPRSLLRLAQGLVILLLAAALGSGCAGRRQVETAPTVSRVSFEEDKRFLRWWRGTSDYNLRSAMEQGSSPASAALFGWVPRTALDLDTLEADAWRVELWYAHHGFFDAQFDGWEIETARPPRRGHMPVVRVVGHIQEGEESFVRSVTFEGLTGPAGTAVLRRVQGEAALQEGDRFDLEAYQSTGDTLRQILQQQSYARAQVRAEVTAYPEELAVDVVYRAELGPPCRFGEVTIEGYADVPAEIIEDNVAIKEGKRFSTTSLAETQRNLFGLGAFSLVQVTPDLSGEGDVIPVNVQLSESRFRQLKVGPGIGLQNGEQMVRAQVGFSHVNLFKRLLALETAAEVGYKTFGSFGISNTVDGDAVDEDTTGATTTGADVADTSDTVELGNAPGGPFVNVEGAFTWPRVFGKRWSFRQELSTTFDREPGYEFVRLTAVPSFSFALTKDITLTQAFHAEFWFLTFNNTFTEEDQDAFCDDLKDNECRQYRLIYPEQRVIWDARNDPLFTTRGYYIQATLAEAGVLNNVDVLRGFSYYRGELDMRRYFSFRKPFRSVLAGRVGVGAVKPYGDEDVAYVPLAERFYLGGASSIRGWGRNYLGPREESCAEYDEGGTEGPVSDDDPCVAFSILPTGGQAAGWGSLEWRVPMPYGVTLALFSDLGMVWDALTEVDYTQLQPSAGLGFRYATPIGPVRLDFAYRLRDDPSFANDRRYALHFALSEAF